MATSRTKQQQEAESISGKIETEEDLEPKVFRFRGRHMVLFWIGMFVAGSATIYVFFWTRNKFQERRIVEIARMVPQTLDGLDRVIRTWDVHKHGALAPIVDLNSKA